MKVRLRPMRCPRGWFALLLRDSRAATAVEYGLIIALIVLVMLAGLKQMASGSSSLWGDINSKVQNASR